ncbi:hypothetical protein KFK09_019611 [Dendrobium nobile]|uniref:Uncharacterized protein n=1 Tax=Dendrobium nobile TaxID=94219 RepID=A0A8T3ARJ3_DENNO|nr:hypothetical protein KFK09_019611 [Dendrobium nobile]
MEAYGIREKSRRRGSHRLSPPLSSRSLLRPFRAPPEDNSPAEKKKTREWDRILITNQEKLDRERKRERR